MQGECENKGATKQSDKKVTEMARMTQTRRAKMLKLQDDALGDVLGGVWLVTLILALLNLPGYLA